MAKKTRPKKEKGEKVSSRGRRTTTPREENKEKPKAKNAAKVAGPMAAIIAAIALLGQSCGLNSGGLGIGFGGGSGVGFQAGGTPVAEETAAAEESIYETLPVEPVSSTAETVTTAVVTEPEIRHVEVTINEDGYIYGNTKKGLEDILGDIREGDIIDLKVEDGASKNNVERLLEEAGNKGIRVIQ